MDCCPAHCVSSGRRGAQWIHLSLQKAGLPVTCSGHWAKHLASHPLFVQWSQRCCQSWLQWKLQLGVTASPAIEPVIYRGAAEVSLYPLYCPMVHLSDPQEQFSCHTTSATCSCVVACYAVSATCLWLRGRVRTLPPVQQHLWHLMLLGTLCWDVLSLKGFWKGSVF